MNQTIRNPEEPLQNSYLNCLRVDLCKDFLNLKYTHYSYTCLNWHLPNQRRCKCNIHDGIFNNSGNEFSTKYSESNGICPDGDSFSYLHKNIGDTERRYHLKNFKTELCFGEMDPQGVCSRNRHHCPDAHCSDDLQNSIQDNSDSSGKIIPDPTAEIRKSMASIDPCWADIKYMMENYKVKKFENGNQKHQELLCPYYHSIKDRSRTVANPIVKLKEEWGDSSFLDQSDNCSYSYTGTELQYHTDVFRTVPCQNEMKNEFCPKEIFCSFSHDNNNLYIPITNNHKEDEIKIDNNSKCNQPSISNNFDSSDETTTDPTAEVRHSMVWSSMEPCWADIRNDELPYQKKYEESSNMTLKRIFVSPPDSDDEYDVQIKKKKENTECDSIQNSLIEKLKKSLKKVLNKSPRYRDSFKDTNYKRIILVKGVKNETLTLESIKQQFKRFGIIKNIVILTSGYVLILYDQVNFAKRAFQNGQGLCDFIERPTKKEVGFYLNVFSHV